jgi:hypothetical protein
MLEFALSCERIQVTVKAQYFQLKLIVEDLSL